MLPSATVPPRRGRAIVFVVGVLLSAVVESAVTTLHAQTVTAPTTYTAYTGTDAITPPPPPALGPANSTIVDSSFGARILRVTDGNTMSGKSLIPSDAGFTRTFNANATAIKLSDELGWSYWLEFNASTFTVGDGSSRPAVHALTAFDARWEWSSVDPDVMYVLRSSAIGRFNKATGALSDLASTPTGEPVAYHAAVVGADAWVCAAAGSGIQDSYTKIFCVNPNSTPTTKFIDVVNRTINGVYQSDPNWPTSGSSGTIGIHSMYGSAGGTWLGVTFHNQSWGANGDAVFNLSTNTWSRVTNGDIYWAGHVSLGNGKFVNGSGSVDGRDARGAVVRDPNDLMNSSKYQFIMQPASTCCWNDGEHSSWFNSAGTPNAPVLFSRYTANTSPWLAWQSEIVAAATDGSDTVWRFAHTYDGGCYYGEAFAEISPDGHWALFSSPWGNTLGGSPGFGCPGRIDTFLVELAGTASAPSPTPTPTPTPTPSPTPTSTTFTTSAIQWTSLVNVSVSGTTVTKVSGCDGCGDAGAISVQQLTSGDGYVEFTASETSTLRALGLSNGNPGTSTDEIAFSIRLQSGYAEVREFGVYRADTSFVTGDHLRVAVTSGQVVYSKNGVAIYKSTALPTYPLLVDTSFASLNSTISDAVIGLPAVTTADTTAPTVSITAPVSGAQLQGTTTLTATASDNVAVTSVQFKVDGANVGPALLTAPYALAWDTTLVANGSHTVSAEARDAANNVGVSTAVSVSVNNTASLTLSNLGAVNLSLNGATIQWTTNLAASGAVDFGTTTAYGSTMTSSTLDVSHQFVLTGLQAATTYHYRVRSATSTQTIASTDQVFTTLADTTPPTVAISAPATGSTVSGQVTIAATASDNVGVTAVQFTVDGSAVGSPVTATPYQLSWNSTTVANGTHVLAAVARDAAGNSTTSAGVSVSVANVTTLTISSVGASSITQTSAVIKWVTNVSADSQVQYGHTTSYGSLTPLDANLVTSHSETISGLSANTSYHYRVKSKNSQGSAVSADFVFKTAAKSTTISNLSVSQVTTTTALVTWTTSDPADGDVEFGPSMAYGRDTGSDAVLDVQHSRALSGLSPATTYHFRVKSRDEFGGSTNSADATFTTQLLTPASGPSDVRMTIDAPAGGAVQEPFILGGWALDRGAATGSGVDALHVWAWPTSGAAPIFVGIVNGGEQRPDVAGVFGAQFVDCGYTLLVNGLPPGDYHLAVAAHSTVTGTFAAGRVVDIAIRANVIVTVDRPSTDAHVGGSFFISGWALDLEGSTGAGIDAVHVWAQSRTTGALTFVGIGAIYQSRADVGAVFGPRFTSSGYTLLVTGGLPPDDYTITVFARSAGSQVFGANTFHVTVD